MVTGSKTAIVSPDKKLQTLNQKKGLTRQSNLKINSVSTLSSGNGSKGNIGNNSNLGNKSNLAKKSFMRESSTLSMRLTQVLGTKKTNTKSYLNAPLS